MRIQSNLTVIAAPWGLVRHIATVRVLRRPVCLPVARDSSGMGDSSRPASEYDAAAVADLWLN